MLRAVRETDAAAIAAIYNWYIDNTVITFEQERVSAPEMAARIAATAADNPWLVLEDDGELRGYAYTAAWKSRAAYRFSRECSVYLHRDYVGRGWGSLLMRELIAASRASEVQVLIAGISLPNDVSIALHEKLGFNKVGVFAEVGHKFGAAVDVGYWQLIL